MFRERGFDDEAAVLSLDDAELEDMAIPRALAMLCMLEITALQDSSAGSQQSGDDFSEDDDDEPAPPPPEDDEEEEEEDRFAPPPPPAAPTPAPTSTLTSTATGIPTYPNAEIAPFLNKMYN